MEITCACALPSKKHCVRAGDSDCGRGAGELFPSLFIILERFTLVTNSHMNFMLCFVFFFYNRELLGWENSIMFFFMG